MKVYQKIVAAIFTISLFAFSAYNFLTMKGFITGEIKELDLCSWFWQKKFRGGDVTRNSDGNWLIN